MPYPGPQIKRVEIELKDGRKFEMLPKDIWEVRMEVGPATILDRSHIHLILDLVADQVMMHMDGQRDGQDSLPGERPQISAGGTDDASNV